MILLKTPAKQARWALSTKIKFDQNICIYENRNCGKLVRVIPLVF